MREKPYAAVPIMDSSKATCWYANSTEAALNPESDPNYDPTEVYDIQYRPGRKSKVKK